MTRRDLAIDAFWTERPLVQRFIAQTGRTSFSLRDLIAFAELLPDVFSSACKSSGASVRSARPMSPRPQGDQSSKRGDAGT